MIILNHFLFCISGVLNILLVQYINMYQFTDIMLAIPSFATYFGYFLAYPSFFKKKNQLDDLDITYYHPMYIVIFLTDILGSSLTFVSVYLAGGQLFTVAYASIIIWTAILRRYILKEHFNFINMISILLIVSGLGVSAISSQDYGKNVEWGILLGILAAIVYSLQYVASEWVTSKYNASPYNITAFCGMNGITLVSAYFMFYTFPNMSNGPENYRNFAIAFVTLAISTFVHSVSFFKISKNPNKNDKNSLEMLSKGLMELDEDEKSNIMFGSVVLGINKALQTVLTFIFSHIFFCKEDEVECINDSKIISICLVFIGIILYSASDVLMQKYKARNLYQFEINE